MILLNYIFEYTYRVNGHLVKGDRVGFIAMDAANAVMTRYRWAEGLLRLKSTAKTDVSPLLDGITGHFSVTKVNFQVIPHRLGFGLERDRFRQI